MPESSGPATSRSIRPMATRASSAPGACRRACNDEGWPPPAVQVRVRDGRRAPNLAEVVARLGLESAGYLGIYDEALELAASPVPVEGGG